MSVTYVPTDCGFVEKELRTFEFRVRFFDCETDAFLGAETRTIEYPEQDVPEFTRDAAELHLDEQMEKEMKDGVQQFDGCTSWYYDVILVDAG